MRLLTGGHVVRGPDFAMWGVLSAAQLLHGHYSPGPLMMTSGQVMNLWLSGRPFTTKSVEQRWECNRYCSYSANKKQAAQTIQARSAEAYAEDRIVVAGEDLL